MVFARSAVALGCVTSAFAAVKISDFPSDQTQRTQETTLPGGWAHPLVEVNFDYPQVAGTYCRKYGGVPECTVGIDNTPDGVRRGADDRPVNPVTAQNAAEGGEAYWRCGNAPGKKVKSSLQSHVSWSPYAGIELLRGDVGRKSLDWVRREEIESPYTSAADKQLAMNTSFDTLFCADYLRRYLNPRKDASEFAGACIRDLREGQRWKAIVTADTEAHAFWDRFGNVKGNVNVPLAPERGGYMKSAPLYRDTSNRSMNVLWGTGSIGSVPANWCGSYMKEMLCHVAFPQYAGGQPLASERMTWNKCAHNAAIGSQPASANSPPWYDTTGACPSNGALVRPVCESACVDMFMVCNRYEAAYCPRLATSTSSERAEAGPCKINPPEFQTTYEQTQPYRSKWPNTGDANTDYNQCIQQECNKNNDPNPSGAVSAAATGTTPVATSGGNKEDQADGGRSFRETNALWCQVWNRGFGLAQSGTGVGEGPDSSVGGADGSMRFCATWSSSSRFAPALLVSAITSIIAAIAC